MSNGRQYQVYTFNDIVVILGFSDGTQVPNPPSVHMLFTTRIKPCILNDYGFQSSKRNTVTCMGSGAIAHKIIAQQANSADDNLAEIFAQHFHYQETFEHEEETCNPNLTLVIFTECFFFFPPSLIFFCLIA